MITRITPVTRYPLPRHTPARTSEALDAISEAEALAERFEQRVYCAGLHRLRGVFLTAIGAGETQIAASFGEAIRIAKEQNSVSLETRAEATRDQRPPPD